MFGKSPLLNDPTRPEEERTYFSSFHIESVRQTGASPNRC